MRHHRRYAVGLLSCALLLAVGTPAYVAFAVPDLANYLLHPAIFLVQLLPYGICAGLWLPRRTPDAAATGVLISALLLLAALVVYVPILWAPGKRGGDMIGLAFVAISAGTVTVLLLASALALLVLRMHGRRTLGQDRKGVAL